jgi:hypothetical protein
VLTRHVLNARRCNAAWKTKRINQLTKEMSMSIIFDVPDCHKFLEYAELAGKSAIMNTELNPNFRCLTYP